MVVELHQVMDMEQVEVAEQVLLDKLRLLL
jgi:hypothetical protein